MQKAPDAFRTISEVATDLEVPQHVLRFWETRFSQIRPMKRAGGRRYYRPQDVDLLRGIRQLLYEEGYTIKGVQKILREHGVAHVIAIGKGEILAGTAALGMNPAAMMPHAVATPVAGAAGGAQAAAAPAVAPAAAGEEVAIRVVDAAPADGEGMQPVSARTRAMLREALVELERAEELLKGVLAKASSEGGAGTGA